MKINVALVQMSGFMDKDKTIAKMVAKVDEACAGNDVDVVVLPEMWNCPYGTKFFREYGEPSEIASSKSLKAMSNLAQKHGVYLFGGSISELEEDEVYNTCFVFDRRGEIIAKHRKKHLFDIDIKGGIRFKESDVLSSGDKLTIVETEFGKVGLMICFDLRFAKDFIEINKEGVGIYIIPAAFNMTTGPRHWELLLRARAVDNQAFVLATAPARDENAPYRAYGHSTVVNPWGEMMKVADFDETILYEKVDTDMINEAREQLPIGNILI